MSGRPVVHIPIPRFSNRVANYVKYRPSYPVDLIPYLEQTCGLTSGAVVADIGSGTGISARIFLQNGNRVLGVEPNDAMRSAAEDYLAGYPNFINVKGTAGATTLEDQCIDLAVAAQAFHWFDAERTKREFARILRATGYAVLIWNERKLEATPFLARYEQLLLKYATDYERVRHENVDSEKIAAFLGENFLSATFANEQVLDFEGLKGRVFSSSYMPEEESPASAPMLEELGAVFAKHAAGGKIAILYDTKIYHSPASDLCQ